MKLTKVYKENILKIQGSIRYRPVYNFQTSGQSFINKNCHNCRTSHDLDLKLGLVTKPDKRNTVMSKKLMMTLCRKMVTSLCFFQFMAILQSSGSRIPESWSIKLTFSLTISLDLTKHANRTQNSLTQLPYYCFE